MCVIRQCPCYKTASKQEGDLPMKRLHLLFKSPQESIIFNLFYQSIILSLPKKACFPPLFPLILVITNNVLL